MNEARLRRLLNQLRSGRVEMDEVLRELQSLPFEDLKFAKVDHHRTMRCGFPEVIFCERKTPKQVGAIARRVYRNGAVVLATRADRAAFRAIRSVNRKAVYHAEARCVTLGQSPALQGGRVLVVTAGTADIPVAEEARVTAEIMGAQVELLCDVGVAGIHRLLRHTRKLREATVLIVVAGMEGALASVVGGLVRRPVIAVPTSVGYGASFKGLAALLAMLNSCAAGVSVVNIDNGFGAGYLAAMMVRELTNRS